MAGRSKSKKASQNREARADYVLGLLGGVAVSPPQASKEAMQYYARAAAEGNPDAQYQLAKLLVEGQTLSTNNRAALKWLKKAVEKITQQVNIFWAKCTLEDKESAETNTALWSYSAKRLFPVMLRLNTI